MKRRNVGTFAVLLGLVATASPMVAQVDQGTITGVVQDTSGAVVPSAQVTLTSTDTGLSLSDKANGSGVYVFSPVKIGNYRVSAAAPGFQTTVQENVHLDVQQRLNVALILKPGSVSQSVTVSAAPSLLQTQSGSVGQVLSTNTINNTPLNGRNWVYIVQLTAGVVPSGGTHGGGTGDFSANGQRAGQNNFIMDGVDNNANILDLMNGSSYNVRPPPDALAEFRVDTADYNAELGHSAGAAVNVSLKSGTNQIHGSLWEYFRNTALDARNWPALTIPPYHENQFGATLGFPIFKNKVFFFGDTEANRVSYAATDTLSVPTPLMRQGNFSELLSTSLTGSAKPTQLYEPNSGGTAMLSCNGQNNVFCPNQLNPIAKRILSMYPLPNANGGKTYNNYVENLTTTSNTFQWDTRLDWNISPKDQAFARLSYANIRGYIPPPLGPILNGSTSYQTGLISNLVENLTASESHFFNPNLVNELRFGINYGSFAFLQPNYNTDVAASLGFGGIPYGSEFPDNGGLPQVTVGGITGFGTYNYNPSVEKQNIYQILDNVTKIAGNHSFKFGVDLQSIRLSALQPPKSRGNYDFSGLYTSNLGASFTGSGVADFLSDQMASASLTNETTINDVGWYRAAYAQDDWKIHPKLTINIGLRYDYFQPFSEMAGRQANFNVTGPLGIGTGSGLYTIPARSQNIALVPAFTSILAKNNIALQYVNNNALVNGQDMNFAPRFGFAYSASPNTVVSGGFGIFYGGLEAVGVGPNLGLNFPFGLSDSFSRPNCAPHNCVSLPETLETGFSEALAAGLQNYVALPSLQGIPSNSKTTNTMSYNLALQRSLSNNLLASIGYVGNITRHLASNFGFDSAEALLNPANSTLSVEPFPGIGGGTIVAFNGQSDYNSLQAKLEKRFNRGLSFLATYTWAHALDDSYDPLAGGVSDRNINLIPIVNEYTNSPYDIRDRFNFNGFYELPFGRGRAHLNGGGLSNVLLGGWSTSLTFSAQTGKPFTVSPDISTAAGGTARAIMVRDPFSPGGSPDASNPDPGCPSRVRTKANWYNPCAFANPQLGTLIPRTGHGSQITQLSQVLSFLGGRSNVIRAPGYERVNMSAFKNVPVWREQFLQLRADVFNVFNTPSYSLGSTSDGPTGGQITGTQFFQSNTPDARFFQISAKYVF